MSILHAAAAMFFPKRCVFCGKAIEPDSRAVFCPQCAAELRACRSKREITVEGVVAAAAPLAYTGPVAQALKAYKFNGVTAHGEWLAAETVRCLAMHIGDWQPEVLTFVPLSAGRMRERGFNQCEPVAYAIAKAFGLPQQPLLHKRSFAGKQSRRTAAERWEKAEGTFAPLEPFAAKGKRVLLLDDIITTGATMADAARALHEGGAAAVYGIAMAATPGYADQK